MLQYVYDCGAMREYKLARDNAIAAYRQPLVRQHLNLLFLSHIHDDHVNGVPELLRGMSIDTIVMPGLDEIERIFSYAKSLHEDGRPSRFQRSLAIDPISALAAFYPRQIIIFNSFDGLDNDTDIPVIGPLDPENIWKLDGKGRLQASGTADPGSRGMPRVYTMTDSYFFLIATSHNQWILKPYVHPSAYDPATFLQSLSRTLRTSPHQLQKDLKLTSFRYDLLTNHIKALKEAYGKTASRDRLNLTSLCLFSGINVNAQFNVPTAAYHRFAGEKLTCKPTNVFGWLATGDARLDSPNRLHTFIDHFSEQIGCVTTLTVPHHGAKNSSRDDLYRSIAPETCVVAADAHSNWSHPHPTIVDSILSATGSTPIIVGSSPTSILIELVTL